MGLMGSKRKDKVEPLPESPVKPKDVDSPFPKKRNCTDVICLLFLLVFNVVLVGLLIYAIKFGDIARITNGYDRCGNICGKVTERIGVAPDDPKYFCLGADMRKKNFLLVTGAGLRETNEFNVNRECVSSCQYYPGYRNFLNRCIPIKEEKSGRIRNQPNGFYRSGAGGQAAAPWGAPSPARGSTRVKSGLQVANEAKIDRHVISAQVLNQQAILVNTKNRFPDILLPLNKGSRFGREVMRRRRQVRQNYPLDPAERIDVYYSKTGLQNFFQEVAEDLELCWKELLALFFIALGFSLVIIILMIVAPKVVVVLSLALGIIVCLVATAYLWANWAYERDRLRDEYRYFPQSMSKVEAMQVDSYLGYAIAASVVSGILLLVLLVTRKRLGLVIRLFEEAGAAIKAMPTLLILPWVTFIIVALLIAGWFYLSLWIESSGRLVSENNVNFVYEKDGPVLVARWWNLLALFWLVQFVMACQHLCVAGAVANWYFARDKAGLKHPVDRSIARTVAYHLGTAAFGAALVAIMHFVRSVWQEAYRWLRPTAAEQCTPEGAVPAVSKSGAKSLVNCCMYPFIKFVAFINRNAYAVVAITGCSFIDGGKRAVRLIAKHALSIAAINSVGDFVLFMAKMAVMLSTMLVAIAMLQGKEGCMHVWVPVTLAALFGYVVAHIFLSVYEMAIDTIFICFCEDCEINDGVDRPYFMSEGLREFIDDCDPKMSERLTLKDGKVFSIQPAKSPEK